MKNIKNTKYASKPARKPREISPNGGSKTAADLNKDQIFLANNRGFQAIGQMGVRVKIPKDQSFSRKGAKFGSDEESNETGVYLDKTGESRARDSVGVKPAEPQNKL